MRSILDVTKALADQSRVRVVLALGRCDELCVCQIVELLALAPSTVSRHLAILSQARLVESRKDGRWVYYRLSGDPAATEAREAAAWVSRAASKTAQAAADAARLEAIMRLDPEELCRLQARS